MIKRPITLLCLSDLHLVPKESGETLLATLRSSIKTQIWKDPRWRPDFVIFSGDMVEASQKDYNRVKEYIKTFIDDNDFHLDPFKIIAVPGNHDKDFPFLKEKEEDARNDGLVVESKKNDDFVKALKSDGPFEFDMKAHFKSNFESFGEFYFDYVNPGYYVHGKMLGEYDYPSDFLGSKLSDIALTSGLKVFHDAKLCFLCINTEWVYMPDKYNTEKEPVQLCTPVIYSSIKSIRKNYHDYTIITVMHRNPSEFTWVTRNRVEPNKPDILRFLYQYSDIILTGHEHIEKVLPPHKMENHAQLFQLGSASVKSRNNNEINHYLASLIHIDPVDGSINLCNFENDGMNVAWGAKVDPNTYPLAHHDSIIPFESIADLGWYGKKMSFDTMPVKSFEKNDMIQALRNRFVGMERAGYIISCLSINDSDLLDGINRIRLKGDKNAIFIYTLSVPDHKMFMSFLKNILSVDSVRVDIYLKKLILSEVRFTYHDPDVNLA